MTEQRQADFTTKNLRTIAATLRSSFGEQLVRTPEQRAVLADWIEAAAENLDAWITAVEQAATIYPALAEDVTIEVARLRLAAPIPDEGDGGQT